MILRPHTQLSVLIVSWNTRELTLACLASLESALEGIDADVVVVDNGSNDGSAAAIAERYEAVRIIENEANRGFAAAVNQGLDYARGEAVLLLNPDAVVGPGVLGPALEHLQEHPRVAALGCPVTDGSGAVQENPATLPRIGHLVAMTLGLHKSPVATLRPRYLPGSAAAKTEEDVEVLSGCFLLMRRTAIDEVGGFDEGFFVFGEETDWCKRARDTGWRLDRVDLGGVQHLGSQAANRLNGRRDILLTAGLVRYHRKHGSKLKAAGVWGLLWGFNASRAALWSLRARLGPTEDRERRATHFREVLSHYRHVWSLAEGDHAWCKQEVRP